MLQLTKERSENMIIKEIPKEDYESAMQLYCLCFEKKYKQIELPLLGNLIGLYIDNNLVGIAQIDYINNLLENKRIAYINSFCIHPDYRNKHLGDTLLKECINICKKNNCNYINLTSNKNRTIANKIYKNNNFEIIDTRILKKDILL